MSNIKVKIKKIDSLGNRINALVLIPVNKKPNDFTTGVMWIHGGGYFLGMKEMVFMSRAMDLCEQYGCVVVSPGYRMAPFYPYPYAFADCVSTLEWMKDNSASLGFNKNQIFVGGESAGGGLCISVCLWEKYVKRVNVAYQTPLYPMMDCRDTDTSYDNHAPVWGTFQNHIGWNLYLKNIVGDVPVFASPALEKDYRGMPPCYTFVGTADPFLSETKTYIENLRKVGIEADYDTYSDEFHAFDMLSPFKQSSKIAAKKFNEEFQIAQRKYFAENK